MTRGVRISRDEAVRGALLATHLFLTVAGTVTGKAARDAIFLSRFTALQMTAIDLGTMVAIALVVWAQLRLHARLSTRVLLLLCPLCFACGDVLLWAGLSLTRVAWLTPLAFLWVGVQASFGAPHASLLANRLLTAREWKRLCGFVGAGAILGWIGGGLITEAIAAHAGATMLLLADGLFTALCPALVWIAWQRPAHEQPAVAARRLATPQSLRRSATLVWTSPHLRSIACLAFLSAAVTTIAGLQFRAIASQSIHASDHLAAFFGAFSLRAGLVALAFQLLVTSRVLDSLGIGAALAIAPAALAAGSLGVLCSGSLAAAVLLKGSDQTLRYSVDRSAVELLYRPLSPREMFEGKTFIDALVSRVGDAAGGVMALIGATVLHLTFSWLSVISMLLLVAWFASTIVARRRYRARLLEPLRGRTVAALSNRALTVPRRVRPRRILDPDPRVRLRTLRALSESPARGWSVHCDRAPLDTALAAEIVGFAVLVDTVGARSARPDDLQRDGRDAIERIARLLFLVSPARYPVCLLSALGPDGHVDSVAIEYLDSTLSAPHRQLLLSSIERWNAAA